MCHILASNRIWAFKFFVGVGGLGVIPMHVHIHVHACMYTHTHAQWMYMAANRKETKEFQISVYFVQIKAKIIKYGFKHTECRLVYVYIMLINFIFDLEMTGMDEVMFRPPHSLKFSPKVLCCWIYFWETQFIQGFKIYKFFCILMAHCNTI